LPSPRLALLRRLDSLAFVLIRNALPGEMAEIGQLRVTAYRTGGHLPPNSDYEPHLRELGADGFGEVLVAVTHGSGRPDGAISGTVMLQPWPHAGKVVTGPAEAEIRGLAVAPEAQGAGVGRALLAAVIERATANGVGHLLLLTQPDMHAAQRLYERAGFRRLPDRDWAPWPGAMLLAYGLPLPPHV
jgi:ribosomal protein S18 acetylase RimI-like enzyme